MFFGVELHDSKAELGSQPRGKGTAMGAVPCSGGHRLIWAAVRERESRGARGGGRENQRVREHRGRVASRRKSRAMRGGGSKRWKQEVALGRGRVDTPLPTGRG